MKRAARSAIWYDVTHEMRRLAIGGRLHRALPLRAASIEQVLRAGGRVVFSADEEEFYQQLDMDHVYTDPHSGRALGLRKL